MSHSAGTVIDWATLALTAVSALAAIASTKIIEIEYRQYKQKLYMKCGPYYLHNNGRSVSWQLQLIKPNKINIGTTIYISSEYGEKIFKLLMLSELNPANVISTRLENDGLCIINVSRWIVGDSISLSIIFENPDKPLINAEAGNVSTIYDFDFRDNLSWRDQFFGKVYVRLTMMLMLLSAFFSLIVLNIIYIGIKYA